MNIHSFSTPSITVNSINQTSQNQTIIQSRNGWVSESDKRKQALDDKYRKINEQNKQFKCPEQHIIDKYQNLNSPYFRNDMTEAERKASMSAEISWLYNNCAGCYDFHDSLFRKDHSISVEVEVAERKEFNRQKVNDQFKKLLDKYKINIPTGTKLTFTINPNDYKLIVSGTDDRELSEQLEKAMNTSGNAKELFLHIIQSRSDNNKQFTREKYNKYNLVSTIKSNTGYNLRDLEVVDGKFVTEDGTNIFDVFKVVLRGNPYIMQQNYSAIISYYAFQLNNLAKNGFDSIPDLVLSIGYENGSLQDIGQKENYGTGKTDWIEELRSSAGSLKWE